MIVRRARPDDARAIAAVHVQTWQAAYAHVLPAGFLASLEPERREPGWRDSIGRGDTVVVAEEEGAVFDFAAAGPARGEDGVGELYAIYVDPAAWGTGAGRELMRAALGALAESGYRESPASRPDSRLAPLATANPDSSDRDIAAGPSLPPARPRG